MRSLNDFCATKNYFWLSGNVISQSGRWDKFLYENIGLGSPRFHTISHLKSEAKAFISFTLMPQCNS